MRQFTTGRGWLTIYQLPSYAPDLNPVEDMWSLLRRGRLSNTAFTTPTTSSRPSDPVPPPPERRIEGV
ncbi:hypothetical protein OK074_0002 [Actinobacteria bacterium OK074]|nr:hypothetical protein OK074_0002 [Actinobacteria bacterium OK074]